MSKLKKILRTSLNRLQPYNTGLSISEIQAKYSTNEIAKLGSNENPYGPSVAVLEGLSSCKSDIHLYPESNATLLRKNMSNYLRVPPEHLIFGNGSEELLSIICRSVIEKGDRVITLYPSFPLHEDYVEMMGGEVEKIAVNGDLEIDVPTLIEAVRQPAKMLIFANPMNPVGASLSPSQLRDVIDVKHPDTLLVLDEAYFEYALEGDYCSGLDLLNNNTGNWIILRTFSKAWGLAGLRIGFGVCSSTELRSALDLTRTPFNVNSMAQSAAVLALQNDLYMKRHVSIIIQERSIVRSFLCKMGYKSAPSLGNFLFFDVKRPSTEFSEKLLSKGTIVKPWKQPRFETFLRVSIGKPEENKKFMNDFHRSL